MNEDQAIIELMKAQSDAISRINFSDTRLLRLEIAFGLALMLPLTAGMVFLFISCISHGFWDLAVLNFAGLCLGGFVIFLLCAAWGTA